MQQYNVENTESIETLRLRTKVLRSNLRSVIEENDCLRENLEKKIYDEQQDALESVKEERLLNELRRRLNYGNT